MDYENVSADEVTETVSMPAPPVGANIDAAGWWESC